MTKESDCFRVLLAKRDSHSTTKMGYIIVRANQNNNIKLVEVSKYSNNEKLVEYLDRWISHEGIAKRTIPTDQEELRSECKHFNYECQNGLSTLYFIDELRDMFGYCVAHLSFSPNGDHVYILEK